jgi:hypothetical protein
MSAVDEKGGDTSLNLSPFTFHASPWLLTPFLELLVLLGFE